MQCGHNLLLLKKMFFVVNMFWQSLLQIYVQINIGLGLLSYYVSLWSSL